MIWNKQTREELKEVLTKELENIYQGKVQWDVNPYLNYQYAEHDKELIVGNVFLSLVNRDKEFRPKDPQDFIDKLIDKLDEVKDDSIQTLEVVKTIKSCSSMSELSTINQRTFWSFFEFTESFVNDFMENEEIWKDELKTINLLLQAIENLIQKVDSLQEKKKLMRLFSKILHQSHKGKLMISGMFKI